MSPIKKPAAINQDYGRQPQMRSGKDAPGIKGHLRGGGRRGTYRAMIGRETELVAGQRTQNQHSEFKKPYYDDEFPEMEHYYASPVIDVPGGHSPYLPEGRTPDQCWDVCKKNHSGAYFDDDCYLYIWADSRLTLEGSEAIIDNSYSVVMEQIDDAPIDGISRAIYKSTESISSNTNVIWTVVQPLFEACPGVDPVHAKSCRKTYDESKRCSKIDWDDTTSSETIGQSDTALIAVINGNAPYAWTITAGSGFTLADASTTGVTNTLISDGAACGTVEIKVVDADGGIATGAVRCTTGDWIEHTTCNWVGAQICLWTKGGDRYYIEFQCLGGQSPYYNPCDAPRPFGCEVSGVASVDCTDVEGGYDYICAYTGQGTCEDPSNPNDYMYILGYRTAIWVCP